MAITGLSHVGCELRGSGEERFRTVDPIKDVPTPWLFVSATKAEVMAAVEKAWSAFRVYRGMPAPRRARFLRAIAGEIEGLGDQLIDVFCTESGLPRARAVKERARTLHQLNSFARLLDSTQWTRASVDVGDATRKPAPKPDLRQSVLPLGPVAVFGASNFPLAYSTAGGDTASALAAGCPVIVKSHPMHAGTAELVAGAVVRAVVATGMPDGVFSSLNSAGHDVGAWLVQHPQVKAVGFTGSIRGGRAVYDLAAGRAEPIPVFAEMGSINPVVFTPAALKASREKWAAKLAASLTLNTGQFCTNPGLVLAPASTELEVFAKDFAARVVATESTCMLHPGIKSAYATGKRAVLAQEGIRVLREAASGVPGIGANYAEQTVARVDGRRFLANSALREEVFGPFCLVVSYANEEELLDIIDGLEGQLTGTVLYEPEDAAQGGVATRIADALQHRVGRLVFNGVPTGVEVCESMYHGGPYPASTDARFTAVGTRSIYRWVRPVAYQDAPAAVLPEELRAKL